MSITTVKDFLDNARSDAYVNEVQVDDTIELRYFNIIKEELENELATFANETFYKNWVTMNVVAGQKVYALPSGTAIANTSVPQFKDLMELSIRYSSVYPQNFIGPYNNLTAYVIGDVVTYSGWISGNTSYFICIQATTGNLPTNTTFWKLTFGPTYYKAAQNNYANLARPTDWYDTNQPYVSPFFMFDNNNIVIYPTPTENITDWLKIIYARSDLEVQIWDINNPAVLSTLTIPRQFYETIVKGMTYLTFKARGKARSSDAIAAMQDYAEGRKKMMQRLGQRFNQPEVWYLPNLTSLMY